jgi:glycerol-3-phosphate dehydrogenase subunit C
VKKINPKPALPPANAPNDWRFWDEADLTQEARRVFEVCHGCRMCVNYCGSFPDMFARVDRDIDKRGAEGAEYLDDADFKSITDLCWQCKLCYIECPYTADQKHEWLIDVPRLLMRAKAQTARRHGVTLQDRVLGEPGMLGAMTSGPTAPIANFVNANRLVRKINERVLGISAEFPVPTFATVPFEKWLARHQKLPQAGRSGTVALFATCTGDYNNPSVPANAVRVLERNGFDVIRPPQQCCGIPNLDGGDIAAAQAKARFNVVSLLQEIDKGRKVVVIQPTCSYTIKKEYPELLGTSEARKVAENTLDLMQLLEQLRRAKTLDTDFERGLGKVAYHAACHLRAQKIGFPGARVLGALPDTEVEIIEKCSAVDGTWGMKTQYYAMGRRYAQKLVRAVEGAEARTIVTDCPLSALRIAKENGVPVLHPVEALAEAYGIRVGEPTTVPPAGDGRVAEPGRSQQEKP